jgi:poly(A) polymerase
VAAGLWGVVDSGLAEHFIPEIPALAVEQDPFHQHKDVLAHTIAVVEKCPADDRIVRLAALFHDIGKPETREVGEGGVSFHHHEVVGARMTRQRMKAMRYPKDVIADVSGLVALHLRFYGYGRGEWTDSAVRRYVTDAGHLLPRLHRLTRSDCTTRNKRKAAQLAADYDALEQRVARIEAQENLARVRPDLDGNAIMELLGLHPGPLVGQAWRYLKELRLERGPLEHDEAVRELLAWAAEHGIPPPSAAAPRS